MLLTVLLIFARESCTRTFVPKRDHLALTMLNVSPTWEYQSPPRLLSIGATLLSVQRCMCFGLTSLLIHPFIYIRARGWNTLCQATELPVRSHKGNEQTDVQDTWEFQWIMSWAASAEIPPVLESATDASSAVDATDPSSYSCHCY